MTPSLDRRTRPTGTYCVIRPRDDLDPTSGEVHVEMSGKTVTAVPENVGLCQVVDIGPDVTNVQPGDICFIDFFDVAQGYLIAGEELYVTQAFALRMKLTIETEPAMHPFTKVPQLHPQTGKPIQRVTRCEIDPLPGYVLTKHAPRRMTIAVMGNDRLIMPRDKTTGGIVGGRNSDGDPCTFVCYEEVVKFTPGAIQAERYVETWEGQTHDSYFEERRLKARIERLENALVEYIDAQVRDVETNQGAKRFLGLLGPDPAAWGIKPGDLVTFCSAFSIQFRALGETFRVVPYKNLLSVVDDAAILEDFNRKNPPPPLVQLYG